MIDAASLSAEASSFVASTISGSAPHVVFVFVFAVAASDAGLRLFCVLFVHLDNNSRQPFMHTHTHARAVT